MTQHKPNRQTKAAMKKLESGEVTTYNNPADFLAEVKSISIGQQFKNLRLQLGLSQVKAANLLNIHVHTISGWERALNGYKNDKSIINAMDLLQYRYDKAKG